MRTRKVNRENKNEIHKSFLNKRVKSFGFAFKGIFLLFTTQIHARFHLLATLSVVFFGFFFKISRPDWCILALTCTAVIGAEAFNTAIETIVDLVSPAHHELAGRAKDLAAGAVLVMAIGALIIGIIIFLPYFQNYLANH